MEGDVPGQHHGGGAHFVGITVGRREWLDTLLEVPGLTYQATSHGHNRCIAAAKVLSGSFYDGSHALLHGHVLLTNAADTGERRSALDLTIDDIVVALVSERHVLIAYIGVDANAGQVEFQLVFCECPAGCHVTL